ncbi:CorA metal ion transporter [Rhizophlyctis rosea]|nr:CorA metal ion transporter [Rhizophlyctis rosea]
MDKDEQSQSVAASLQSLESRENAPLLINIHTASPGKPQAIASAPVVPLRQYFDTAPSPHFAPNASSATMSARPKSSGPSRRSSLIVETIPVDDSINVGAAQCFSADFVLSNLAGGSVPNWRGSHGSIDLGNSGGKSPKRSKEYSREGSSADFPSSPQQGRARSSADYSRSEPRENGVGDAGRSSQPERRHTRHQSVPAAVLQNDDPMHLNLQIDTRQEGLEQEDVDQPGNPPAGDARMSESPTDMTPREARRISELRSSGRVRRNTEDSGYPAAEQTDHTSEDDVCLPAQSTSFSVNYDAIERYLTDSGAPSYSEGGSEPGRKSNEAPSSTGNAEDRPGTPGLWPGRKTGAPNKGVPPLPPDSRIADTRISADTMLSSEKQRAASRMIFYSQATGALGANRFEELDFGQFPQPVGDILRSGPFWIDVTDPTHAEMVMFSRIFGIHPLTTEDIQIQDTREKCEMFVNYYFICIRTFDQNQYSLSYMQPINVYMVVFKECILSFHSRPIDHPTNVLRRISQLESYGLNITPDWINYALIDDITDAFMPLLQFIELEVDSIDDLVLILKESEQSDMLRRIGHARKKVMGLLRLLTSKADVLKMVIKRTGERGGLETTLYLGDIQDHVITMVQNLSHYEKTLARSHSNYLAQISIEITQASNRTSDVVMRMTALASILVPLNVITGLWGMNVPVPGRETEHLGWFFGIVAGMICVSVAVFVWVKRNKLV